MVSLLATRIMHLRLLAKFP